MSRRRSTGDLVPRDITEILAREARAQRGHRRSSSSFGQAFSWLKGSRRKKGIGSGLHQTATGVTVTRVGVHNHDPTKAGPKGTEEQKRLSVHYTASQHYQENVFIEGSRPQYLEDLHSEAQEGLKILQQEEHRNGVSFPDDESIASTNTLQPEQDISSKDGDGCSESRSPTGNTDATGSCAVSTRPVLSHQGSTFKPLNPVKSIEKNKKRSRRTTIMGIPNQVQKELALRRNSTFQQLPENDNASDSQSGVVIIPTVNGGTPVLNEEGARVHLSELEVSGDEKLLQKHLQGMSQDEQHVNFLGFGRHIDPTCMMRPKSVAVPGMTSSLSSSSTMFSFLQEPQGPVMSMSPQATYMSTIIPNAVLPASIEVIEIDHGLSRRRGSSVTHGSVRTVSKTSLGSGDSAVSPLLCRRSDIDSSQTDTAQNLSILISASTSASNLSESQSSKTIVSFSSPASSKKGTYSTGNSHRLGVSGQENQQDHTREDLVSLQGFASIISSATSKGEMIMSQSDMAVEDTTNKRRSLSVTKTRQPPAPPRRTNSLHSNKIRNSTKVLVESQTLNESVSGHEETGAEKDEITVTTTDARRMPMAASDKLPDTTSGTGMQTANSVSENRRTPLQSEASASSPNKTTSDGGKFERTISPSSGYSSQSGTPTLTPKGMSPTSPEKQKTTPSKPERSVSRASSAASPSSSLTSLLSGTSEPVHQEVFAPAKDPTTCNIPSALRVEIKNPLNIPPPPKVRAPCPPPPEAWVHNRRTVELICGPYGNVCKVNQATQIQDSTMKQAGTQTEETELPVEKHMEKAEVELSQSMEYVSEDQTKTPLGVFMQDKCIMKDRREVVADVQKQDPEILPNKDLPVVTVTVTSTEELSANPTEKQPKNQKCSNATSENPSPDKNHTNFSQNEVMPVDTLSVDVPKFTKESPPPTPPPAYHPTTPPSRRTPPSTLSLPVAELQKVHEETHVSESCWPPPPPPLEGDSAYEGGDETDFPLPPPPPLAMDTLVDTANKAIADKNVLNMSIVHVKEDIVQASEPGTSMHPQKQETPPFSQPITGNHLDVVLKKDTHLLAHFSRSDNSTTISCSSKRDSLKVEDATPFETSAQPPCPVPVPAAPPSLPENPPSAVNFRRQPSVANRGKEFLSRHKSMPIPKEDANIPLVTPSLLQMVRLRSVNVAEEQVNPPVEDKIKNEGTLVHESCPVSIPASQSIPQKPTRKSLSLKSSPQTSSATVNPPSLRLEEAIRKKTAAMSTREGLLSRPGVRMLPYNCDGEAGALLLNSPDGCDTNKSPASTASFIFSRSNKKVVIDTIGHSPEAQTTLKQSLAAELRQVSEQSKASAYSNGGIKSVLPPVAKKPAHGSKNPLQILPVKMDTDLKNQITPLETTTTRVTADTIETLF